MSIERLFWKRFLGNGTAYGGDDGFAVRGNVTPELIRRHLEGTEPIGIYPIVHDEMGPIVHWGCCDIDTGDWTEAYLLAKALQGMKIKPVIERSRSKGWHVWVFLADGVWVPASTMRRALKVAYQVIDLPAKEANPKQEKLRPEQLGNYVRLPYARWRDGTRTSRPDRQVVMKNWTATEDGDIVRPEEFLEAEPFTDSQVLEHWASKWFEPPRKTVIATLDPTADVEKILAQLPPKLAEFARNGPVRDRSEGMVALAFKLKDAGVDAQNALTVIAWADMSWGKQYQQRTDGEGLLFDIIERAYG